MRVGCCRLCTLPRLPGSGTSSAVTHASPCSRSHDNCSDALGMLCMTARSFPGIAQSTFTSDSSPWAQARKEAAASQRGDEAEEEAETSATAAGDVAAAAEAAAQTDAAAAASDGAAPATLRKSRAAAAERAGGEEVRHFYGHASGKQVSGVACRMLRRSCLYVVATRHIWGGTGWARHAHQWPGGTCCKTSFIVSSISRLPIVPANPFIRYDNRAAVLRRQSYSWAHVELYVLVSGAGGWGRRRWDRRAYGCAVRRR